MMLGLSIFFTMAMFLYIALSLLLQIGVRRLSALDVDFLPDVSILIAARNEEANLAHCLEAVLANDYPQPHLEILVIDDRSTDGTRRIAQGYAQRFAHLRVVALDQLLDGMSGKASAICQGMEQAKGEIILIIDADCLPSPQWIRRMVSGFTPETGMVGGFTLLSNEKKSDDDVYTRVQNLDWIYLLSVGAGAAGLGKPVSILGNNFGFRRAVYDAVGGYRCLGFTIIEDCALMTAMIRQTEWRVRFLLEPDAAIISLPPQNWRTFLDQRKRWSAGGKEVPVFGKILLVAAFLRHLATFLGLIFIQPVVMVVAGALLVCLVDFSFLWFVTGRLRCRSALSSFFLFQVYFLVYSFAFAPIVALPTTVRWKNVDYHWGFGRRVHKIEESHDSAVKP